jgi:hypothetical protein
MSATPLTSAGVTTQVHQQQLRRAVVASTIGTAIEWYDFFLYSTVTGLVFRNLPYSRALITSSARSRRSACMPSGSWPGQSARRFSGTTGIASAASLR